MRHSNQKLLDAIEKSKSIPAIVEGKKDKEALESLGFNNVLVLHSDGKPLYAVLDKINGKECAILTDIDKKGKQYYDMLRKELMQRGIRLNNKLRIAILRNRISHIEGLATFVANISP
jgi:5S rRNA maturation endonuclease (ribonuclease M5)